MALRISVIVKQTSALLIVVCLSGSTLCAQEKHVHKELPKKYALAGMVQLGDHGLLLEAVNPMARSMKELPTLHYYTATGELVWEKHVPARYYPWGEDPLLATPTGNVLYMLSIAGTYGNDFTKKDHHVTRISKDGTKKYTVLKGKPEFGKQLLAAFCDEQYLYYLTTLNGDETSNKKKVGEKMILNRFAHDGLAYKRFVLDLPPVPEGDDATYWMYLGSRGDAHYLVSKTTDTGRGINIFDVATFTPEGKVSSVKKITLQLDKKFTRPAWDLSGKNRTFKNFSNLDFAMKTSRSNVPNMGPTIFTSYIYTAGAFGYLMLDAENSCFYAYGLLGPAPFKIVAPVYEGFYIVKYNLEGNEQWRLQQTEDKALMEESYFRVHSLPSGRDIRLDILPAGELNFTISFKTVRFNYDISASGNRLGMRKKEDVVRSLTSVFSATEKLPSEEFIKKSGIPNSKTVGYSNILTSAGEILIRMDKKKPAYDLYYFKK